MTGLEKVAKELHMDPKDLLNVSLKTYLEKRLAEIEADFFLLTKKHGVKTVEEMDEQLLKGQLTEEDVHDDYFRLDHLESERKKIKSFLETF